MSVNQSTEHLHNRRRTRNPRLVATQTASPPTLTSLRAAGDVADGDLPAAAADEGRGRAAPVEGARAKVQGGADGAQSLQPVGHRQMPDRRGLVSHGQAARAAERPARGRGKKVLVFFNLAYLAVCFQPTQTQMYSKMLHFSLLLILLLLSLLDGNKRKSLQCLRGAGTASPVTKMEELSMRYQFPL